MSSHSKGKVLAIACMDCRHSGKLEHKLSQHLCCESTDIFMIRLAGGFGNFASLQQEGRKEAMLKDIGIAIKALNVGKVFGFIHGSSESDPHGCGAYAVAGFADKFSTPERSNAFVTKELNEASLFLRKWLDENGHSQVTMETMSVCFDEAKENILSECRCPQEAERTEVRSELVAA